MKRILILLLIVIIGCVTTKNIHIIESKGLVRIFERNDKSLLIGLGTPISDWNLKGSIDTDLSYTINENGEKYFLSVEPFQLAHDCPKPTGYTSDVIWLLSSDKQNKMPWANGSWKLFIFLKSDRGLEKYEATFKL